MIPALAALQTMPGSAVYAALRDALLDQAARIRGLEETLIRIGHATAWHEQNSQDHRADCAAAALVELLRSLGEDDKAKGKKPSYLVQRGADVVRSSLIIERQRQDNPVGRNDDAA